MSAGVRHEDRSMSLSAGTVNSPERRKAKNPRQHAAQSILMSYSWALGAQSTLTFRKMSGVMGRRGSCAGPACACDFFIPFKTYSRNGKLLWLNRSGKWDAIWR